MSGIDEAIKTGRWFAIRIKNTTRWEVRRLVHGSFEVATSCPNEKKAVKIAENLNRGCHA